MQKTNNLTWMTFFILFFATTSCYRMPTDDDFSENPTTNNPAITGAKTEFLPGMPRIQ